MHIQFDIDKNIFIKNIHSSFNCAEKISRITNQNSFFSHITSNLEQNNCIPSNEKTFI